MSVGKGIAIVGAVVIIVGAIWAARPLFVDQTVNEALPGGLEALPIESAAMPTPATQGALPNATATPAATAQPQAQVLGTGQFSGFDAAHNASGTARVIEVDGKSYVRFESDFTVTNGPDLFVYFGNNNEYDANTNLGRLKGNQGSQNYPVPPEIDPANYSEVWVWCRAFSTPFGKATLQ